MKNHPGPLPNVECVRAAFERLDHHPLDVFSATELSPSWQRAFIAKRVQDPSYGRLRALIVYMDQHAKGWRNV